jgi:hypothetical protein
MSETGESSIGTAPNPAELALTIYNLLFPHDSELRRRVLQSAMTLLGEAAVQVPRSTSESRSSLEGFDDIPLGVKASKWIQRHGLTRRMLEEVFHLTGESVDLIASTAPGASKKEMTVNCYLLCGIRGLLKDDVPSLNEADVLATCKRLAAYDRNNHTTNRLAVGNRMSGSRPTFTLTGPGEAAAAELIKHMGGTH